MDGRTDGWTDGQTDERTQFRELDWTDKYLTNVRRIFPKIDNEWQTRQNQFDQTVNMNFRENFGNWLAVEGTMVQ